MSESRRSAFHRPSRRISSPRDSVTDTPRAPRDPLPARLAPVVPVPRAPDAPPLPDLLNVEPVQTVDAPALVRALMFSFVAGDDGGAVAGALDKAPIAASTFEPACFFDELFVRDFVRSCMPGRAHERYLLRVMSQPPSDAAVRAQRAEIWGEIAESPTVRAAVELVNARIRTLFDHFRPDEHGFQGEEARRRIDVLRAILETFEALVSPALAESRSCLRRVAEFAAHVRATEAHARLEELLRYENERAYADLTLQLSADGRIRGLRVVAVREDTRNRYHVPLYQQWLARIGLFIRGLRVPDGEIVDRWLDQVFDGVCGFLPALVQLGGDLDVVLAGVAFRDLCTARGLPTCFPTWVPPEAPSRPSQISGLFNPLLLGLGVTPVACSLEPGPRGETMLVTGPNSGGKTRLLQAVGLLQLCAQAGMYVPAASAHIPDVPGIFASLSQPAGAEQSEGRLGTELLRIRMLFERAEPGTLVLVDELCSGTSPSEGEELFRLVLDLLRELRPVALISTHFLRFAADLADQTGGAAGDLPLRFLRVDLDEKQRPTYHFSPGVADTSLAQQTAARLGVTREELRALLAAKRL